VQDVLFADGSDLPLFSLMPVPVIEREAARPRVSLDQMLLLEPACRTCLDLGEIRVGQLVRFCWCPMGDEVRRRKATKPRKETTNG
jgi:hypothetical protein